MGKIKISLISKLAQCLPLSKNDALKDAYKIISLRGQIKYMLEAFDRLDITVKLSNYRNIQSGIFKFQMFDLDEERMRDDLGINSVLERLTSDRNKIYELLKDVKEVDTSEIKTLIREEKINEVIQ